MVVMNFCFLRRSFGEKGRVERFIFLFWYVFVGGVRGTSIIGWGCRLCGFGVFIVVSGFNFKVREYVIRN